MPKDRKYRKLTKDQQIAIADQEARAERVRVHLADLDLASADALPDSDAARAEAERIKAEAEAKATAREGKAKALAGKAPSKAEREARDKEIAQAAADQIEQLIGTWEEPRFRHALQAEAGENVEANEAAIAIYDARLDAAEAKLAALKGSR